MPPEGSNIVRLVFPGEGVYVGETESGALGQDAPETKTRHGKGTMFGLRGDLFEGEWKNDMMHGQGTHAGADGSVYVGSYADHMRQGFGRLSYSNGDLYEGEWHQDNKHGSGTLYRLRCSRL